MSEGYISGMRKIPADETGARRPLLIFRLIERPVLHDVGQVLTLAVEQGNIGERVAIDSDQVGAGAGGNDSELARTVQQLRIDDRRRADDVERRHRFGADHELARLMTSLRPQ